MKKITLYFTILLFSFSANCQTNFEWDNVIDSLDGTKEVLYSKTKLFIAETWKSANSVIQLDDKEGGVLLLKGISVKKVNHALALFEYSYSYSIKFMMKDGKCRIILNNVYCENAHYSGNSVLKIEPFEGDDCPRTTSGGVGLSRKKAVSMMVSLKRDLQNIVDLYEPFMTKELSTDSNDDW